MFQVSGIMFQNPTLLTLNEVNSGIPGRVGIMFQTQLEVNSDITLTDLKAGAQV